MEWLKNIRCVLFHDVERRADHPDVWTYKCHDCNKEWYWED